MIEPIYKEMNIPKKLQTSQKNLSSNVTLLLRSKRWTKLEALLDTFSSTKSMFLSNSLKPVYQRSGEKSKNQFGILTIRKFLAIICFYLKKVHYSGEQGKYANELLAAQERAQTARLGLWKNWEPPKEVEEVVVSNGNAEPTSRNVDPKEIAITEVTSNMCFYGQYVANGAKLEELTKQLRNQFAENPPTAGSYTREFHFFNLRNFNVDTQ